MKELFRLGIPIGLTTLFEAMLFNSAALMMGLFGVATLAAHQIAITIPSITFMVPLGIGLAATVRVGLARGAGDAVAARRAGFVAIGIAALFMGGFVGPAAAVSRAHRPPLAAGRAAGAAR